MESCPFLSGGGTTGPSMKINFELHAWSREAHLAIHLCEVTCKPHQSASMTNMVIWGRVKNFVCIHHALRVCSHYFLEQSQSLPPFWSIKVSLSVCWSIKIKPQPSFGGWHSPTEFGSKLSLTLGLGVPPPDLKRNHPRPANNTLAAWNDPAYMVPSWLVRCQFLEREICS